MDSPNKAPIVRSFDIVFAVNRNNLFHSQFASDARRYDAYVTSL